ncbi:DEAD/DEAH box helicase [Acinetobacter baumannii]|uniref:Restriction endonuclease n=4 Tax=Acinetobacter TaxID=469 RepID=A0A335GT61_ACIBA|nr:MULTISPECIES: DEAD/DEAH box helicase family protein [Acinetobacter]NWK48630.1 DEAD/DEAH box helicase family protein [Acinetobacter sp. SwsAc7]MBH8250812.1 DEAD/DEAH box helicase family protein [Acinetobacter baumannii]MCR4047579.1 DEAD/DEAH box helicase family protein [Acinetobacter baumannii]MCW3166134.1 DEAD/DEAH box helicase family protein [Acinetobacter baumannii]MDD9318195.1 DEAD/DEAH box helicase family protein [Acinetobacter lactucae]
MTFQLKNYQSQSLQSLENYLTLAASLGAEKAFNKCVGEDIKYNDRLDGIPSVCLRVPTGGGKTVLASHSIAIAARNYVNTDSPIVLWLVPTDMIRQQTLLALSDATHPYRKALQGYYGDRIKVCDIESLQTLNKHDVNQSCIVIVTTIQAFNIDKEKTYQRNAYAFDESLSEHFTSLTDFQTEGMDRVSEDTLKYQTFLTQRDIGRVKHSLVNFFHLHRPIIIVDEAHKNRGGKTFFTTLKTLNPSCLIELTATPKDNNVLYSVSAAELKSEEMIKLPVVLTEHTGSWQDCIRDALIQRQKLEVLAQNEREYIRPILLIQAQDKNGDANVNVVKEHLLSEYENITNDWIAISTGGTKELEDENLFSPKSKVKIVITVEALKEGWDCSFAYVLASLQNINSATDVEQLLGRVLRMPYAKLRQNDELNKAYAHVISSSIAQATMLLKDRMIQNMGFEKWEADATIVAKPQYNLGLGGDGTATKQKIPETMISVPFEVKPETLSEELKQAIQTRENSQGTSLIINKGTTNETFDKIEKAVIDQTPPKQLEKVQEVFNEARAERQAYQAPENWNASFASIPQLGLFVDGMWQIADKETIEDSIEWNLLDFPIQLEGFSIKETVNSFEIDLNIDEQKLNYALLQNQQAQFSNMPTLVTETDLINWLDRKVSRQGVTQVQLRAYLTKLLSYLLHVKNFTLTQLHRAQFQLSLAITKELDRLFELARQQAFQGDLFSQFQVANQPQPENTFKFEPGKYPVKKPYRGGCKFEKHFYAQIDDLREKTEGGSLSEEFRCAQLLEWHSRVKYWVRNIPKQPQTSFWLPTGKDYFYPDFVAELDDGSIFVLEYKGSHLDSADDARVKDAIGRQWAKDSQGKRIFLMATKLDKNGRSLEDQINHALAR